MADKMAAAVIVHSAYKYYGEDDDRKIVLDHLNMTVEKGTIYGLLGPSGCGKTTLLSCIVGRRKLNSGDIWVLGGKPGTKGSGVPGPRIGYMPQDIALVAEFTVKDAVYYFGRIFGMSCKKMKERFAFLSDLLELPPEDRLLKNLSGGQQRRVSFAAALVQDPELLILDEPTVGLDPVLREKIWNFLVDVTATGTAVIITTHYIDETKQAHKIGLLRGGHLLAEESPSDLLRRFGTETLEDAFLALAHKQQLKPQERNIHAIQSSPEPLANDVPASDHSVNPNNYDSSEDFTRFCNTSTDALSASQPPRCRGSARGRYRAVFIKSMQQFARHPGGLIFAVMFPIIQVVAFFSAVGHDPRHLGLAVVNEEASFSPYGLKICNNKSIVSARRVDEDNCDLHMTSCRFIDAMEESGLHQVPYSSLEEALVSVRTGAAYGAMFIAQNFSESLQVRFKDGTDVEDGTLNASSISIWLDMTNHQISNYVKTELYGAYRRFSRRLMTDCGFVSELAQIPVRFHAPIYGEPEPKYSTFMAPGAMMTILFFLAATITSTLMISDRLEGVWERSAVAGVRPHELLAVHIGIHSAVILFQTIEMMVLAFVGYGLPYKGQIFTIGLLLFLQGLSGMCYGFLLSVCCSSYTLAFFISTGSFYPMILLCGILWPLEGMSTGLRLLALLLPFTIPSISFRDLMEKGFTILHYEVYNGFIVTIVWIVVTLLLCILSLRWRKN